MHQTITIKKLLCVYFDGLFLLKKSNAFAVAYDLIMYYFSFPLWNTLSFFAYIYTHVAGWKGYSDSN